MLLVLAFVIFWWYSLYKLPNYRQSYLNYLFSIPLLIIAGYLIWDNLFNRKKNFTILLDHEGVQIGEEYYRWTSISETAMLQLGSGRNRRRYLILVFEDGSYKRFNLQYFLGFLGFRSALAAYIEYFKSQAF